MCDCFYTHYMFIPKEPYLWKTDTFPRSLIQREFPKFFTFRARDKVSTDCVPLFFFFFKSSFFSLKPKSSLSLPGTLFQFSFLYLNLCLFCFFLFVCLFLPYMCLETKEDSFLKEFGFRNQEMCLAVMAFTILPML